MNQKERIAQLIDAKKNLFAKVSDQIWDFAEVRFELPKSAAALCELLSAEGFCIKKGLAGMEDAFVAEYGSGSPVIGILAEYDALAGMSQVSDAAEQKAIEKDAPGHGCGHNLLGGGSIAGAVGIKDYMEEAGLSGTIRLFGCPAEESGYGKTFMARDGVFDGLDAALTWHPFNTNALWSFSSLAVYQVYFRFKGVAAHAANAPELGRSALDAAELMNVGVNFLREHIIDAGRVHYAFMDVGGTSANVVQPTATLFYFVRAPKLSQARAIYDRVVKIAQGAAMMTETEVEVEFSSAAADYLVNRTLGDVMYENMKLALPQFAAEEMEYARPYYEGLSEDAKKRLRAQVAAANPGLSGEEIDAIATSPIQTVLPPNSYPAEPIKGSTDVGDVSWMVPTAQAQVVTYPNGTPAHSWQWVTTGKSPMAHRGMLSGGKTIAFTALDLLTNPEIVEKAKQEHSESLAAEPYVNPIPAEIVPKQ